MPALAKMLASPVTIGLPVRPSLVERSRGYIACGLWVLSTALMVFGIFDWSEAGTPAGFAFGVFVALMASVFTIWSIVDQMHDVSVQEITEILEALHQDRPGGNRFLH